MFGWRTTCLRKRSRVVANVQIKKKKSYNRINRYTWGRGRVSCRVFIKCRDLPARERVCACMQDHARVTKIRGENRKGAVDQADRTEARKCLSVPGEPLWNVRSCLCPPAWERWRWDQEAGEGNEGVRWGGRQREETMRDTVHTHKESLSPHYIPTHPFLHWHTLLQAKSM